MLDRSAAAAAASSDVVSTVVASMAGDDSSGGEGEPGVSHAEAAELPDEEKWEWRCHLCTVVNPPTYLLCSCCGSTRSKTAELVRPSPASPSPPPPAAAAAAVVPVAAEVVVPEPVVEPIPAFALPGPGCKWECVDCLHVNRGEHSICQRCSLPITDEAVRLGKLAGVEESKAGGGGSGGSAGCGEEKGEEVVAGMDEAAVLHSVMQQVVRGMGLDDALIETYLATLRAAGITSLTAMLGALVDNSMPSTLPPFVVDALFVIGSDTAAEAASHGGGGGGGGGGGSGGSGDDSSPPPSLAPPPLIRLRSSEHACPCCGSGAHGMSSGTIVLDCMHVVHIDCMFDYVIASLAGRNPFQTQPPCPECDRQLSLGEVRQVYFAVGQADAYAEAETEYIEHMMKTMAAEPAPVAPPSSSVICSGCGASTVMVDMVWLENCPHSRCRTCLRRHIGITSDGAIVGVRLPCPEPGCDARMMRGEVKAACGAQLLRLAEERSMTHALLVERGDDEGKAIIASELQQVRDILAGRVSELRAMEMIEDGIRRATTFASEELARRLEAEDRASAEERARKLREEQEALRRMLAAEEAEEKRRAEEARERAEAEARMAAEREKIAEFRAAGCHISDVPRGHADWERIQGMIGASPRIKRLQRVVHKTVGERFFTRIGQLRDPTGPVLEVFHGSRGGTDSILKGGYEIRGRGGNFGRGLYFSTVFAKAMAYTRDRRVIVNEVAVGYHRVTHKIESGLSPEKVLPDHDCVWAYKKDSNGNAIPVGSYCGPDMEPAVSSGVLGGLMSRVSSSGRGPARSSRHDEVVVYHKDQARPTYVITV
eukprot:PLAT11362.1.p1 GENE.PLAT11362.1~~PLAT11362.1.p1  ORF type:complete len:959 (+),score=304.81 PLAT11362.1:404-2878(+)